MALLDVLVGDLNDGVQVVIGMSESNLVLLHSII
jgi:hypothetical protein